MALAIPAFLVVLVHAVPSRNSPLNPAVGQVLQVQGSGGNLRMAPSPDARLLVTLPSATRVRVRKVQGDWVEVRSCKRRGG